MTNHLLCSVTAMLVACSTAAPPPTKVFDFSEAPLVEVATPARPTGPLRKASVRAAIQAAQARLVQCAKASPHPAGTIDVTLRIAGDPDVAVVESVDVRAFGSLAIATCMQDALLAIELLPMAEPAVWTVHYPFVVDANS